MREVSKDILESLRQGDHKSFEIVFLTYFGKVRFFIEKITRSEAVAEELAQDIFLKLWENRQKIDTEKNFNNYIQVVARNSALNYLRDQSYRNNHVDSASIEVAGRNNSEDELYAKETQLLLDMAVDHLPERRKKIYSLSRQNGLTNEEIARELGVSKKTVENQLTLALKELREALLLLLLLFII